jgi:hypothetical protein
MSTLRRLIVGKSAEERSEPLEALRQEVLALTPRFLRLGFTMYYLAHEARLRFLGVTVHIGRGRTKVEALQNLLAQLTKQ